MIVGVVAAVLLFVTSVVAIEYFKQLRKAQKEYEQARDVVESVVLSFNNELRREAEKIQKASYQAEEAKAKAESGIRKAEGFEKRLEPIENQILQIDRRVGTLNTTVISLSETNTKSLEKLSGIDANSIAKLREIVESQPKADDLGVKVQHVELTQENLKNRITGLEQQLQKLAISPENLSDMGLPTVPVIPIKRDRALAALTETEVTVLEFLSAEGAKTAPEITQRVKLSREHTARLMKKLYEEGYLERETVKLPFKYSVKEEMAKLLKKPETPAT